MAALSVLERSRHDEARPEPSRITDACALRLTKLQQSAPKKETRQTNEKKIMRCPVETDF